MKTCDLYRLAIKLLSRMAKENPNQKFTNKNGESATIQDVIAMLQTTASWMYPELATDDVVKVVHCKNCLYYKTYKKKGEFKTTHFHACSKDMQRRPPDFFCKDGDEQ